LTRFEQSVQLFGAEERIFSHVKVLEREVVALLVDAGPGDDDLEDATAAVAPIPPARAGMSARSTRPAPPPWSTVVVGSPIVAAARGCRPRVAGTAGAAVPTAASVAPAAAPTPRAALDEAFVVASLDAGDRHEERRILFAAVYVNPNARACSCVSAVAAVAAVTAAPTRTSVPSRLAPARIPAT
jgi:hypothetical protein